MNELDETLIKQFRLHQEWLDTIGKSGKQLVAINAQLRATNLSGRDFSEAILPEAMLDDSNLAQIDFYAANLASASLIKANLEGATLVKANLDYAKMMHCNLRNVKAVKTSFVEADLGYSNLADADLSAACMRSTNLEGAYLRNANLHRADLYGTRLVKADLVGIRSFDTVYGDEIMVAANGQEITISGTENIREWLRRASKGQA